MNTDKPSMQQKSECFSKNYVAIFGWLWYTVPESFEVEER